MKWSAIWPYGKVVQTKNGMRKEGWLQSWFEIQFFEFKQGKWFKCIFWRSDKSRTYLGGGVSDWQYSPHFLSFNLALGLTPLDRSSWRNLGHTANLTAPLVRFIYTCMYNISVIFWTFFWTAILFRRAVKECRNMGTQQEPWSPACPWSNHTNLTITRSRERYKNDMKWV